MPMTHAENSYCKSNTPCEIHGGIALLIMVKCMLSLRFGAIMTQNELFYPLLLNGQTRDIHH